MAVGVPVVVGGAPGVPVVISGIAPGIPITVEVTSTTAFVVEDASANVALNVDTTNRVTTVTGGASGTLHLTTATAGSYDLLALQRSGATKAGLGLSAADTLRVFNSGSEIWGLSSGGLVALFGGIATKGWGNPGIFGLDNRTGLTTADGAPITLYTAIAANQLYRASIQIFATAAVTGTATYTLTWTEDSTAQTLVVTATAINTQATATAIIRPDNGTAMTAQLTGVFTGTFTVAGLVEVLA